MSKRLDKNLDRLRRPWHWLRSRRLDLAGVNTLCLTLGPNRNMTTLTAGLIALHPQCQALNHAWRRQRPQAEDLLLERDERAFERFVRAAVMRSLGGRQGRFGGSVVHSHAFQRPAMRAAYQRRFGRTLLKPEVRCVYWKSAKQVTAFVRENDVDLLGLVDREPRLRFLMPLRNPLDCALSNYRKGHYNAFAQLRGRSVEEVIAFMTELVGWFLDLRRERPEHFFGYRESEYDRPMLARLAGFLGVDADEQWMADCLESKVQGSSYDYEDSWLEAYRAALGKHLAGHPEVQREFAERAGLRL